MAEQKAKVTVWEWETFDGKVFETQEEAEEHESVTWDYVKMHLSDLEESLNEIEDMDLITNLHEGSKKWFQYSQERNGSWSHKNKKEGFLFLKLLYLMHFHFESHDKGKNFDWLIGD